MAALTGGDVVPHCRLAARDIVRVVAGQAGHLTALEACRLRQPVRRTGNLELVAELVRASAARGVIEVEERLRERRARDIRPRRPAEAAELKWQRAAGRLEVALQTDLQLTFPVQLARVDDGATGALHISCGDCIEVPLTRAVTALAIDAFGQSAGELRSGPVVLDGVARIAVVARHAALVDHATKVEVRRPVVPGTHGPRPATLRVPAQGQLHQPAVGSPVHERPRVVAGTDYVVCVELDYVRLRPTGCSLMATLHERAVPLGDGVMAIRRRVVEAAVSRDAGQQGARPGRLVSGQRDPGERSGHAGQRVGLCDPDVAAGTRRRVGVALFCAVTLRARRWRR